MARRSGVQDFLTNFNTAFDVVGKVGKSFEQARAMTEKPSESAGYTAQDGEMLRGLAEAKDADGNLAYQLDPNQDGTYGLKVRSADGSYTPAGGDPIRPGLVTDFYGQRTSGALTQPQIDKARYARLADIETKYDPKAGMQMRRELANQEREDRRFAWEEQSQPLKQRAAELQVSGGERQERQGVRLDEVQQLDDAVAQMPVDALEAYASKLNTNDSPYPMLYIGQNKDGFKFVSTDPTTGRPTGKNFTLNEAQLRQMASASVLGLAGYGQESLTRLSSVNKEMADHIKTWNDALTKSVSSENDALHKGNQDRIAQQNADTNSEYRRMMGDAAAARAAGGGSGGKGADAMWTTAERIAAEGRYGGSPEKAYAGLKRGTVAATVQEQADKLEMKLREQMAPESEIQKTVGGFLVSKGLPPSPAVAALRRGVNSEGKPLTAQDYADWNRTYPSMPVEDVLGAPPVPSAAEMEIMRKDAAANGIRDPQFSWSTPSGLNVRGALGSVDAAPQRSGLPPRETRAPRPVDPAQAAYDEWQNAKREAESSPAYFQQRTPLSAVREAEAKQRAREAEQRYLELIRNPQGR